MVAFFMNMVARIVNMVAFWMNMVGVLQIWLLFDAVFHVGSSPQTWVSGGIRLHEKLH